MDLFEANRQAHLQKRGPLAARMRLYQRVVRVEVLAGGAIGDQTPVQLGRLVVAQQRRR